MVYGLIIAAGKQSRFGIETPKALMPYGEKTLLDINVANMETVCDMVLVVTSLENYEWFNKYRRIIIESGKGCGDAVLQALNILDLNDDDTVFIQWGDCLHTKTIYHELRNKYDHTDKLLIPCVKEESPYVQLVPRKDNTVDVYFSKYGEKITEGFHDLSLFYGKAKLLRDYLYEFANKITVNDKYVHKHNNEMQFLDVFNETELKAEVVEFKGYETFDFNTVDEFHTLMESRILR